MIEAVSIEPMLPSDVEAVARIDRRCYPSPWLTGAYATELGNRSAAYLVARLGSDVVGYGGQWVNGGEAHITTLAVEPAYQRRRVGERLLIALIEEAWCEGASHITLEVRQSNRPAQKLYQKYGFEAVAIRRNYYTDNGENALVMWATAIRSREFKQLLRDLRQKIYA